MASTWWATSAATRSCASAVEAPRWGVTMTLAWRSRGESAAGGSSPKTSSAAAAAVSRQDGVQGAEVALLKHLIEGGDADAEHLKTVRPDAGVVGDDVHLQGAGAPRHLGADAAEAEEPQRLAAQLDAEEARAVPAAFAQGGVRLGYVAGEAEHEGDRVLGGGDGVRLRRVDAGHAATGRRVDVDVVDADAGAADDLEVAPGVEDGGGDARLAAHDEALIAGNGAQQLAGREAEAYVNVGAAPQDIEAVLGDRVGDEDARHARV